MNNISYRIANIEDINDFTALIIAGNENYIDKIIYGCKGINKFILGNMKNNESSLKYFVAQIENKVIGAMEIKILKDNIFLNYIAIDNKFRGKRIGSNLIKYGVEYLANQHNYKKIQLDVFEDNVRALKLYKKLGFKIINKYEWSTIKTKENQKKIVNYKILNKEEYKKIHSFRGFSNITIEINKKVKNIGMLGKKWFRIVSNDIDDDLINCLSNVDDREILSIGEALINISNDKFNINKLYNSYRMENSIEDLIINLNKEYYYV